MKRELQAALMALSLLGTGVSAAVIGLQTARPEIGRSPVQRGLSSGSADSVVEHPGPSTLERATSRTARFPLEFRSIDGTGNNPVHPELGAAEIPFLRLLPADYADGAHAPAGDQRLSAREISNLIAAQGERSIPNGRDATDFLWMWGQFLDHDIDETPVADPAEELDIAVPLGDPWFDPQGLGVATISLDRSAWELHEGQRQQINLITAFIDASNVYGSDVERALTLRTLDGTGRLRTSEGNLLPVNDEGLANAPSARPGFFLAGDVRANEQVALLAMHTLFVREHNHWAGWLALAGLDDGEEIYQIARAIVAAEMQVITYREFLPLLLGPDPLPEYLGYRPDVDPGISNEFAAAAYRVGHTMLSPTLLRLEADGSVHAAGHVPLAQAFFDPVQLTSIGLEPYLRGLAGQRAQNVDSFVIDDVRNMLFGAPGAGGFDLVSLNVQRGRDHGLPSYDALRQATGRSAAEGFEDVCSDPETQKRLASAYRHPGQIDAWVGLLAEDHAHGALVGPTLQAILADQFTRLRDGDRFWYQNYLPPRLAEGVERQTLARVIRRNTAIDGEIQDDVFRMAR